MKEDNIKEPAADIARCSGCGWSGDISECSTDTEGDWESGYYTVHICPNCDESYGCINDYIMSKKQYTKWLKWYEDNSNE